MLEISAKNKGLMRLKVSKTQFKFAISANHNLNCSCNNADVERLICFLIKNFRKSFENEIEFDKKKHKNQNKIQSKSAAIRVPGAML